jgi:hypothetical protein
VKTARRLIGLANCNLPRGTPAKFTSIRFSSSEVWQSGERATRKSQSELGSIWITNCASR